MKTSTFLIALLAMVSAFSFVSWQRLRVDIVEDLNVLATQLNDQAPIDVDEHTDMIGAHAEGKEIVYQYRVHGLSREVMSTNEELLRASRIQIARADKAIQRMLKSGATLTYEYFVGNDLAVRFSIEEATLKG